LGAVRHARVEAKLARMLDDLLLGNYKTVSERLGLVIDGAVSEGHLRIHGAVDGVALEMWFGAHATHVRARLSSPAPIELSIVTTSLLAKLAHVFTGEHTALGDPQLDKTFSVKSGDPQRVASLLDSDARAVLLELADKSLHPAVDQESIHLRRFSQGGVDSEEKIERDFREAARLAKVISASFARERSAVRAIAT